MKGKMFIIVTVIVTVLYGLFIFLVHRMAGVCVSKWLATLLADGKLALVDVIKFTPGVVMLMKVILSCILGYFSMSTYKYESVFEALFVFIFGSTILAGLFFIPVCLLICMIYSFFGASLDQFEDHFLCISYYAYIIATWFVAAFISGPSDDEDDYLYNKDYDEWWKTMD